MLPQQPAYIFIVLVSSRALPHFQNRPVFHPKESYDCVLFFFFFYTTEGVEALLLIKVSDMNDMRKKCSCLPGNRLVTKGTVLEEQRPAGVFIRQRGWLWQDSK